MAVSYTVVGPVVKRVTRNVNKPPKDPKPQKGGASIAMEDSGNIRTESGGFITLE